MSLATDIVKALQRLGFTLVRQAGSHVRLTKGEMRITVPMHRFVLAGTLQGILRQADLRACLEIKLSLNVSFEAVSHSSNHRGTCRA